MQWNIYLNLKHKLNLKVIYVQKKHQKKNKNLNFLILHQINQIIIKVSMLLKHQHLMKQFINIFKLLKDKKKINQQLKKLHGRNLKILNKIK